MVVETGWDWFNGGGVELGDNAHHSMKHALQGVKIFAQEPTLGIFRLFAVLQHIQNRSISPPPRTNVRQLSLGSRWTVLAC